MEKVFIKQCRTLILLLNKQLLEWIVEINNKLISSCFRNLMVQKISMVGANLNLVLMLYCLSQWQYVGLLLRV